MQGRWLLGILAGIAVLAAGCSLAASSGDMRESLATAAAQRQISGLTASYEAARARVTQTVEAARTVGGATPAATAASPMPGVVQPSPTPTSTMPIIRRLACDPCSVEPGGTAQLSWEVQGAAAITLAGRVVVSSGTLTVQPDQTTSYRLVAGNDHGRSEQAVTVEVPGLPVIHFFTCLPCEIRPGQVATLSWDLSGGTAAYLDGYGVPAPGSSQVAPDRTTTYRLTAVSDRGSVERLVTVAVLEDGDFDRVKQALVQAGYRVRWAGELPMGSGDVSAGVVMASAAPGSALAGSQPVADQYFRGLVALHGSFPDRMLSIGLYDGVRSVVFVTVGPASFESLLRGELDGYDFWQEATWNRWDEWSERWAPGAGLSFGQADFESKGFGR